MAGVLMEELPTVECQPLACGGMVIQGRPCHLQSRRAKSQAQCGTQQRSGSHDPRSRGPRGRSRDFRRVTGSCGGVKDVVDKQAVVEHSVEEETWQRDNAAAFKWRPSVGTWCAGRPSKECMPTAPRPVDENLKVTVEKLRVRACDIFVEAFRSGFLQRALEEVMDNGDGTAAEAPADRCDELTANDVSSDLEDEEEEENEGVTASTFICGLLEEVVEDYSDEAMYEIRHEYEAARVYDVPWPGIEEEDECSLVDEVEQEEDEAQVVSRVYSSAAELITKVTLEEAADKFMELSLQRNAFIDTTSDSDFDCEEVLSVSSESCDIDDVEEAATQAAQDVAEEIVWKPPVDEAIEELRMTLLQRLSSGVEDGSLERSLRDLADAERKEKSDREAIAEMRRTLLERLSNGVEDGSLERTLQGIFAEEESDEDAEDSRVDPVEDVRQKMRFIFQAATETGELEATLSQITREEEAEAAAASSSSSSVEGIRLKMRNILQVACESGRLDVILQDTLDEADCELPVASTLSPCTRPSFSRQFHPRLEAPPIPEEPFPCDCLPPSAMVARPIAPASEAWLCLVAEHGEVSMTSPGPLAPEANERMCRALAVAALQSLYSKHQEVATPQQISPSTISVDAGDRARVEARNVLAKAVMDGRLQEAIAEMKREREDEERKQQMEKFRTNMLEVLSARAKDGSLQKVFEEVRLERVCDTVRNGLIAALDRGTLEEAIREEYEECKDEKASPTSAPVPVPTPPAGPSTVASSPARRRIVGPRTVTTAQAQPELPMSVVPTPPPRPQTTSANPQSSDSFTPTVPSVPSTVRPTRAGSRPRSMLAAPSSEGVGQVAAVTPRAPTQPASLPTGVRRPARPGTLSVSKDQTIEQVTHSFRIDSSPDNSPQATSAARSSSIAESYRTLGTAQFFCIDGNIADKEWQQTRPPKSPRTPSAPRKHAGAFVVASVSDSKASVSHQKMLVPMPPPDDAQGAGMSEHGNGPTALELDLGLTASSGLTGADIEQPSKSTPVDVFATNLDSPRLFKNAVGTGFLPVIPPSQSTSDVASWSIGHDHRPTTPRSARNRQTLLF